MTKPESVTTKFIIKRTSLFDDDVSPIRGAKREKCDRIERRTCTEKEFDIKFSKQEGLWRSRGIKHSTYNGGMCIKRVHPKADTKWFINISSLDDLRKLEEEACYDLIISFGDQPSIEIYDAYRE